MISVIIPAHNEARVIGRLLEALLRGEASRQLDVVVVCNGCTDNTASVAGSFPGVRVVTSPEASKSLALRLGDDAAAGFPRAYVDADVVITGIDLIKLGARLAVGHVMACGPVRHLVRSDIHPIVRWYYDVWEQLPAVRTGLFGRGVVVVNRVGWEAVRTLPMVMSDDLAMSGAFRAHERAVVSDAVVTIYLPRNVADLVRRRVRVATGTDQVQREGLQDDRSRTTIVGLGQLARGRPDLIPQLTVFLAVTAVSRLASARRTTRGDFSTWLRDESSRQPPTDY